VKPGRIRVFDGLRVATEHVEHLQDALHSSIEDIRGVLGLGRVFDGFDVQREGDAEIVVGPGLAFDRRRNRIVIDEPQRIAVAFPPGQETRYVCVRYEEVEDGEVEGRSTLLWDSAAVVLADALPGPEDDVVPIARLVRSAEGEGEPFRVVTLTDGVATGPAVAAGPGEPATGGAPIPSARAPSALQVQQGLVDLPRMAAAEPAALSAMAAALRARGEGVDVDGRVVLASTEVSLGFRPAGLSCATSMSASLQPPDGAAERSHLTAHGEATFADGGVTQFGLSMLHAPPAPPAAPTVALEEARVARLPLGALAAAGEDGLTEDVLEHIHLVVEASPAAPAGFGLSCVLVWRGDAGEDQVQALEASPLVLAWGARIGWKAMTA